MGKFDRDRGGRDNRRSGGGGGFSRGGGGFDRRGGGGFSRGGGGFDRPAMHKAICDSCHKECEVPFKPRGDKPIYCSDCFSKQGGGSDRGSDRRGGDRKPHFESHSGGSDNSKEILKGIKTLNYKLDELIKALGRTTPAEKTPDLVKEVAPKKASPENKTVAKKAAPKKTVAKKAPAKKAAPKKAVAKKKK